MDYIKQFLDYPIVSLTGYVLTVISGVIAISQYNDKLKEKKRADSLSVELRSITEEYNKLKIETNNTNNNNAVTQGNKSQYFQDNTGPVIIDNRG